jgi:hypothetical protein
MEGNELTYFLDYGARIDNSLKDPNQDPNANRRWKHGSRRRHKQALKAQRRRR